MSSVSRTYKESCAHAESKDLDVKIPGPRELFVDIDDEIDLDQFTEAYQILAKELAGLSYVKHPSPGGKPFHYHIVVTLPFDVTDMARIALQACLGSDFKRELLSYVRHKRGEPNATLFFEKKMVQGENLSIYSSREFKKRYYGIEE